MTAARNAAIWFAADGYDPAAKGINGRRVAGESFLRGYLRHADVDQAVSLAHSRADHDAFAARAAELRPGLPARGVMLANITAIAPLGVVYYPSPNFAAECWRRAVHGAQAWAVCGITHTTSTAAVMQGFHDLRMAPQADWDAVICTSRAVQASVLHQMDLIDDHIKRRFNAIPPARPLLPVIPLGLDSASFAPDPAARADLRSRIGAGAGDVVLATIARLTPHEKFDPLPLYLALAQAQTALAPDGPRLHLVLCGLFRDDYARGVFEQGARALMPDVPLHLLDGASAADRRATLSGADVYVFAIDNIQETFGLAPIEGMAAGLPMIVSDWDGMRDTVTPDCGFRIPTRTLRPEHTLREALRYQGGADSYVQYCASVSAMTRIDVPLLAARIVDLAANPDLRARMGRAAQARARAVFDWAQVIPQMQDLWAEQNARRARAAPAVVGRYDPAGLPVAPSPFALFGAYPTQATGFGAERWAATHRPGRPDVAAMIALRNYAGLKRLWEPVAVVVAVQAAITAAGPGGINRDGLAAALNLRPIQVDRVLIWLLKYDFIQLAE